MAILGIAGLIVGLVASKLVKLRGDDPRLGICVGGAGAIVAGIIYSIISGGGIQAWNLRSVLCALAGAVLAVVIWHAVRSRYATQELYVPRRSH